ncbi:MAG: 16S rRNA (cytosine(1402)-N(4))-methyltransferase RsmH [Bacteroidales bacterium]|nr:16S rRNA (cytosine(1402)-N(4))-methyltransferase RsmH [Bacteroidales bacterium]
MGSTDYHIPVLLRESIAGLSVDPKGVYLDLTYGGGGHSHEILRLLDDGRLVAFDQDSDVKQYLSDDHQFDFIEHNYRHYGRFLDYLGIDQVDGILADLGVSSHHLDAPERGFSFRFDAPLDMRMNQKSPISAHEIVNAYSHEELTRVIKDYGEINRPAAWSAKIIKARETKQIMTTTDLVNSLKPLLKRGRENKDLARIFQALRIEVNKELDGLAEMLEQSLRYLKPGGRLVVISYHSLEDRLVKNFMRSGRLDGVVEKDFYGNTLSPFKLINRKVILSTPEELERNSRARSAKLRIAEKIG